MPVSSFLAVVSETDGQVVRFGAFQHRIHVFEIVAQFPFEPLGGRSAVERSLELRRQGVETEQDVADGNQQRQQSQTIANQNQARKRTRVPVHAQHLRKIAAYGRGCRALTTVVKNISKSQHSAGDPNLGLPTGPAATARRSAASVR